MNNLCNACNLRNTIEFKRKELNELIISKDQKLLDESIINMSQTLDAMVFQCTYCYKNLNRVSQLKLENIFNTPSSFFYYGEYHLFTTIYFYILEASRNKELLSIYMEDKLFIKLLDFLRNNNAPLKHVKYKNIVGLIKNNHRGGLDILKEEIKITLQEKERNHYEGIRWIGQPADSIVQCSQKEYMDFCAYLTNNLKNNELSLLYIYDAYEYMNKIENSNESLGIQSRSAKSLFNQFAY